MNSEIVLCSSAKPSSTLPAGESNDVRSSDRIDFTERMDPTALRVVAPLLDRSRGGFFPGRVMLSARAGVGAGEVLPELATIHLRPFISCSHLAAFCSRTSTVRISSAFSSACRSVRLRRYAESREYLSVCARSASRNSSAVAFASASTLLAGSSRTGVRIEGASVSLRAGEDGMLTLIKESGDLGPCVREGLRSFKVTREGSVRRGLTGDEDGEGAVQKESAEAEVGAFFASLEGGEGSGSFGGPVVGGECQVRLSGGGNFRPCGVGERELADCCGVCGGVVAIVLLRARAAPRCAC